LQVRAAILETDESAWQAALTQESSEREGARSASAPSASSSRPTGRVAPASSVAASVLTPARNLSFTDHDGHRFQCFITDQGGDDLATLEVHHRARARRGPLPRGAGVRVRQSPFREFGPRPCGSNSPSALRTCSPTPARWYSMESSPALSQSACVTGFCASPGASTDLSPGAARRQRGGRVLVVTCPQTAPARRSGCPGGLPRRRPGMMRSAAESTSPARRR